MKRSVLLMLLALLVLAGGCAGIGLIGAALGFLEVRDKIAEIRDRISGSPDVTLTVLLDGYVVRTDAPNALGAIDLGGLPEGAFLLGIVAPDHRGGWQKKVTISASGGPFSVVPVIGPLIYGTVTRQATSGGTVPAAGVLVAAFADGAQILADGHGPLDVTAASTQDYMLAITDDLGRYVLGPSDFLGNWLVTAYSAGYQADARTARVNSGVDAPNTNLSLTAAPTALTASMTGTVTRNATGLPLAAALVRIEPSSPAVPVIPAAVVTRVATATGLTMPPGPWFRWGFTATTSGAGGTYALDFPAGSLRAWAYKFGYKGAYQVSTAAPSTVLHQDFRLPDR
jgi:hypothetical protein